MANKTKSINELMAELEHETKAIAEREASLKVRISEMQAAFTPEEIEENAKRYVGDLSDVTARIERAMQAVREANAELKSAKAEKKIVEKKTRSMLGLAKIKTEATPRTKSAIDFEHVLNIGTMRYIEQKVGIDFTLVVVKNPLWYDEARAILAEMGIEGASSQGKRTLYACTNEVKRVYKGVKFPMDTVENEEA